MALAIWSMMQPKKRKEGGKMEKTVFALLTDARLRSTENAETHLSAELSAGCSWFDSTDMQ